MYHKIKVQNIRGKVQIQDRQAVKGYKLKHINHNYQGELMNDQELTIAAVWHKFLFFFLFKTGVHY